MYIKTGLPKMFTKTKTTQTPNISSNSQYMSMHVLQTSVSLKRTQVIQSNQYRSAIQLLLAIIMASFSWVGCERVHERRGKKPSGYGLCLRHEFLETDFE